MPFPKGVREAGDVAKELRGSPISNYDGTTLLLNSYKVTESGNFGKVIVLECEDEDGGEVKMSTFSEVVIKQVEEIGEKLPLLITPRKVSNYYTIF